MPTITPKTLKGFRDFLPREARKRHYVINILTNVFASFGFEPLETPVLEYEEILTGKYGDEGDKLMYRFEDNGKRRVAMRYDQTVPTARVVAQYQNEILFPFKRYQIQPVWRADKPQKGRYREFFQCDIDIIGVDSALADAEIIATAAEAYKKLGFTNSKILINDRSVFQGMSSEAIICIDKLKKIGLEKVCEELVAKGVMQTDKEARDMMEKLINQKPTERIQHIFVALEQLGIDKETVLFSPTIARGLNYYTGMIFEIETPDYPYGSLCGGGRYNDLIGMFAGKQIPAAGLAIGFDRTLEAMEALNLFPNSLTCSTTTVLVTIFAENLKEQALAITKQLRENAINTEIYLGEIKEKNPLEKQLKYANQKNIPYVIVYGPEEAAKKTLTLKNMQTREQQQMTIEEAIKMLAKFHA
jgi:histidyl-tRNA synthetase